jgi:hypothetical protein
MSAPVLSPNPYLVAIILMIKTGSGVHHVFHYPPNPGKDKPHASHDQDNDSEETSSSSSADDKYSSLDEEPANGRTSRHNQEASSSLDMDESASGSPEKSGREPWKDKDKSLKKDFLGLPVGVKYFLCPPSAFHKKRFEMTIDGLVFLGWPVFANEHGEWKRRKKTRRKSSRESRDTTKMATIVEGQSLTDRQPSNASAETAMEETTEDDTEVEDENDATNGDGEANDLLVEPFVAVTSAEPDDKPRQGMQMFHVVFVMNPPPLEYHVRVDDMYRHVVKKFSRALRLQQGRSNFVHKECDKIRTMDADHSKHYPYPKPTASQH